MVARRPPERGDEQRRTRAAYNACLPLLTAYHTELAQNEQLCAAYQRVMDHVGGRLEPAQRKLLENACATAWRATLPAERARFGEVMVEHGTGEARRTRWTQPAWSRHVR
jgi:oligopeptidase A